MPRTEPSAAPETASSGSGTPAAAPAAAEPVAGAAAGAPPTADAPPPVGPQAVEPVGPSQTGRRLTVLVATALAIASGLTLVAAFPPYGLWWLAPVAVAMLAVATAGQRIRRGAWLGALAGAAFFAPLLHWTSLYVGALPWLLLVACQAAFFALLGAVLAGSSRLAVRLPWSAPLITAVLWIGAEALRSRLPWGGFPWGRLAFSQDESPFLRLASLGGAPLVTFAVALCGGLLAAAVWPAAPAAARQAWSGIAARVGAGNRAGAVRAAVLLACAALVALGGAVVPLTRPDGRAVTVAVIQGNVPRLGLDFNAQRRAVLENHVNGTLALARRVEAGGVRRPDLVVWPENSSDIDPLVNADARRLINQAAARIGVPILVGAVLDGPGRYVTNAGIVWDPRTGPGARYAKRHPVPFAEYIPLRSIARMVSTQVDRVRRDFRGGDRPGALTVGPATVGDVICFEVAYDSLVADTVDEGADLLVVQTNNATFGMSAESAQQLAMVRLRAVEHGRPAIMASTSGVSATVTADGRVLDESELFTAATFVRRLRLGEHRTLASAIGGWPEAGLGALALAALVGAGWLSYRAGGWPRRRRWHRRGAAGSPLADSGHPAGVQTVDTTTHGTRVGQKKEDA